MRPAEVLDHQASLIDYLHDGRYKRYLNNFINDMVTKDKVSVRPGENTAGDAYADSLIRSLKIAQAFHVQPDMMPLLRAAAMDLEGTDYLVHERLPAEHGFLLFDEPWLTKDIWDRQVAFGGFAWRHGSTQAGEGPGAFMVPGIWLTFFVDLHEERDDTTRELLKEVGEDFMHVLGRWQVSHVSFLAYERRVGPIAIPTDESYDQFAREGDVRAVEVPNDTRMIVALFRLLNQVIVDVSEAPVDRATARRMGKKRLPARVQTIRLRRKERPSTGDHEPQYTLAHQFPVRGHWAWRACSEHHPFAEPYEKGWHARVYVAPHWRGPENAPILLTSKVWDLAI